MVIKTDQGEEVRLRPERKRAAQSSSRTRLKGPLPRAGDSLDTLLSHRSPSLPVAQPHAEAAPAKARERNRPEPPGSASPQVVRRLPRATSLPDIGPDGFHLPRPGTGDDTEALQVSVGTACLTQKLSPSPVSGHHAQSQSHGPLSSTVSLPHVGRPGNGQQHQNDTRLAVLQQSGKSGH